MTCVPLVAGTDTYAPDNKVCYKEKPSGATFV
jgi:hypothetical protein